MRGLLRLIAAGGIAAFFFFSWIIQLLWNSIIAGHLGLLPELNYLQAAGLWFLVACCSPGRASDFSHACASVHAADTIGMISAIASSAGSKGDSAIGRKRLTTILKNASKRRLSAVSHAGSASTMISSGTTSGNASSGSSNDASAHGPMRTSQRKVR